MAAFRTAQLQLFQHGGQVSDADQEGRPLGRMKYTEEERSRIMISFIHATRKIIDAEGIEQVSIRKIAALTGMNSATMYLYFSSADVLITMASMSYLEEYCRTLAEDMPKMHTPEDTLLHTWDVFSRYAFASPDIFYHIFFETHSVSLSEIIDQYYSLFPEQLHNIDGPVLDMLHEGLLSERSWHVLRPVAEQRGMKEEDARIVNDMLVSYFRFLLEERRANPDGALTDDTLIRKLKQAIGLLLS